LLARIDVSVAAAIGLDDAQRRVSRTALGAVHDIPLAIRTALPDAPDERQRGALDEVALSAADNGARSAARRVVLEDTRSPWRRARATQRARDASALVWSRDVASS
jgi:hypothetical protein